jgi:hypothetical protein
MAFFLLYDVISGYDVTIPAPDVAQIVVRTFFYLHIKFEAELYTWWVCRPFLSKIFIFLLFIAPISVHPLPLLRTPFCHIMTHNLKVAGLYKAKSRTKDF